VSRKLRPALLALSGATLCVLLISCANLSNLLLAQALFLQRELAVRSALGAGRGRIARQLLTEAMLLSAIGGVCGIYASHVFSRVMIGLYPDVIARLTTTDKHPVVYVFGFAVTLSIGLLIGMLPAWRGTRESSDGALRVGHNSLSPGSRRWADGLVVFQVGLTAVLLIAAGLLLNSFFAIRSIELGLEKENIVTSSVSLPITRYPKREDRAKFVAQWLERLQNIPGVELAGVSNSLPLRYITLLHITLRVPAAAEEVEIGGRAVVGDYFKALGMRFVAGVPFDANREFEIAVIETFAAKYLRGLNPVGLQFSKGKITKTIPCQVSFDLLTANWRWGS